MVDCPECFREVVPLHNMDRGIARVAWWCDHCETIYPDDDYVSMEPRPLGFPQ